MAVLLIAFGTRGDVAPAVNLALALREAGITARVAAASDLAPLVESAGVGFVDLRLSMGELMTGPLGRAWVSSRGVAAGMRATRKMYEAYGPTIAAAVRAARMPGEAVVSGMLTFGIGAALAESHGVPHACVLFAPMTPSSQAASTMQPLGPGPLNRLSCRLALRSIAGVAHAVDAQARAVAGLRPLRVRDTVAARLRTTTLYGVSPLLLPPDPAWPGHVHVTGHWLTPSSSAALPGALEEFLDTHPGAIWIGFGSIPSLSTDSQAMLVDDALRRLGRAGVVPVGTVGGPTGDRTPNGHPGLFVVDDVPHHVLFPRLATVVHHGGAGTATTGLIAGVPAVTVPQLGDQPYWGRRLHELGVGPAPLAAHNLTASRLASAVAVADSSASRAAAARLAPLVAAERGAPVAARIIADLLRSSG